MSIKIRRYHADESEFTFTGRNKTKITVPGNVGFTDLTQSNLVLDMHVHVTTIPPTTGQEPAPETIVLYPATFGLRGQVVGAQSLIRNAIVTSREHGLLNERRHQNVIDSNIDWYLTSRSKEDQRSVYGHCNNKNYGHDTGSLLPDNPWLLYNLPPYNAVAVDAFTTAAVKRRAEIPVAWKHIDQFASMPKFPNIGVGDLDYNIELENQIVVMSPAEMAVHSIRLDNLNAVDSKIGTAGAPLITTRTRANFNRPPMVGDQVSLRYIEVDVPIARVDVNATIATVTNSGTAYAITFDNGIAVGSATEAISDIVMFRAMYSEYGVAPAFSAGYRFNDCLSVIDPVGGVNYLVGITGSPLVLPNVYTKGTSQQHMCPFYVGAPIYVTGNIADTAYAGYHTVSSLRPNGANLEVILDTGLAVGTVATPTLANVRVAWRDHTDAGALFTVTWTIDEMYAKMHEIQMQQEQLNSTLNMLRNGKSFAWLDQRLLQQTVTATSTMTQVIELQPNCYSVALLTPQTLELLSGFDGATSYRFALDGKEQSSRDIVCGTDPTTGRSGHNYLLNKYFMNLGQALSKYDANYYDYGSPDDQRTHAIYTQVTPFIPRQQTLQVQLFAGSNTMAAKNLFFVSTHERSLNLSNGRVTVS